MFASHFAFSSVVVFVVDAIFCLRNKINNTVFVFFFMILTNAAGEKILLLLLI